MAPGQRTVESLVRLAQIGRSLPDVGVAPRPVNVRHRERRVLQSAICVLVYRLRVHIRTLAERVVSHKSDLMPFRIGCPRCTAVPPLRESVGTGERDGTRQRMYGGCPQCVARSLSLCQGGRGPLLVPGTHDYRRDPPVRLRCSGCSGTTMVLRPSMGGA
jgi:hypothetical protein